MRNKHLFVGFSTYTNDKNSWKYYDKDLVKRDLLNHLYTRKGERLMMPEYGCIIWDMLMDPLTENTREIIQDDILRIIQSEPRVTLNDMKIVEVEKGFIIYLNLYFRPWDVYETFSVEFDRRAQEIL